MVDIVGQRWQVGILNSQIELATEFPVWNHCSADFCEFVPGMVWRQSLPHTQ